MGHQPHSGKVKELDAQKIITTLVVAEPAVNGRPGPVQKVLAAARKLGTFFKQRIVLAALYAGSDSAARDLAELDGPETIYCFDDPLAKTHPQETALAGLLHLNGKLSPDVILFSASAWGAETAARTAASLGAGLLHNLIGVERAQDNGHVIGAHLGTGNGLILRHRFQGPRPWIATINPDAFVAAEAGKGSAGIEYLKLELDPAGFKILLKGKLPLPTDERPCLENAQAVVAGGQGVGGEKGFSMLRELADLLGGAVGGTLPPVEQGWIERDLMIGATGKRVRPQIYIGCGISGDTYHTAGMEDSEKIVVINNDEKAPFFKSADVGIIGDLHQIVPCLIAKLKSE